MKRRIPIPLLVFTLVLLLTASGPVILRTEQGFAIASYAWLRLRGGYSIDERIRMHAGDVEGRLRPRFDAAGVSYPPAQLAYIAFKDKAQLEVYARTGGLEEWRHVLTYPILGMSGTTGPKLREGDMQVPEGIYRAELLNPNSRFHLSIRLNYPNDFDLAQAQFDGRTRLGSDIMIHGTASSIGCLAMGNRAAEDLFILAALAGKENVEILIAPTDFRHQLAYTGDGQSRWISALYLNLQTSLNRFSASFPRQHP